MVVEVVGGLGLFEVAEDVGVAVVVYVEGVEGFEEVLFVDVEGAIFCVVYEVCLLLKLLSPMQAIQITPITTPQVKTPWIPNLIQPSHNFTLRIHHLFSTQ